MEDQTLLPIIMIVLLLAACYFSVLRALMQRSRVRNALPAVAEILLFIFALLGGTLLIISATMGAELVLLALLIMISLVTLCASIGYLVQNYRSLHMGPLALLVCYLMVVAYVTLFSRSAAGDHRISLLRTDLFIKALQMHSLEPLRHVFLNMAMFVPIGFFLPTIQPQKRMSTSTVLFLTMTLSVLIETVQLLLQIGQADLTDVIANTLGGAAGFLIYCLLLRFVPEKEEAEDIGQRRKNTEETGMYMERPEQTTSYHAGKNAVIDFWVVCCIVCRLGFPGILSEYSGLLTPLFDYGSTFLQIFLMMAASGDSINEIRLLNMKKKYSLVYLMIALLIVQSLLVASNKTGELTTCVRFAITAVFGLWLADHYGTKRLLEVICRAQNIFVSMNLLLFFVFRNIGFYYDEEGRYLFRGLQTRKNPMGQELAFGLVLYIALLCMQRRNGEKFKKSHWFWLAAQVFLLLETQATGAIFTAVVPIAYLLLREAHLLRLPRFQWGYLYIVVSVAFLIAALTILPAFEPLLQLIGKDATLSNRTRMWEKIIPFMLNSHTFTGYGLLMFWYDDSALQSLQNLFDRNSWFRDMTYGSHNTLLEMWLDVGLIGIGIFFLVLLYSFRRIRRFTEEQYLACSAFMLPLLIRGLTERSFTNANYLTLYLFVVLGIACTGSDVKPPLYPRRPFLNQLPASEEETT